MTRKDAELVHTKRADYIVTALDDGSVVIVSSPHDPNVAGERQVYRDMGAATHWLKFQQEIDAGRRHATQGLLKGGRK